MAQHCANGLRRSSTVRLVAGLVALWLAGCSGGSGGNGGGSGGSGSWTPGVFLPAATFAAQCAAPRSDDPANGRTYPDVQGAVVDENNWLRSWSHDLYLWYDEIDDRNPANHTTAAYFDLMRTFLTTPSGRPKDRFHFTFPTAEWEALSQSGLSAGYGTQWAVVSGQPPREIVVAYTHPDSPATEAGITRGTKVLEINGVDAVNATDAASVAILEAGLFPELGETHRFEILDPGEPASRTVWLEAKTITQVPVQNLRVIDAGSAQVGYLLFTDHIATAEQALIDAIDELAGAGIDDLVLDLRYNGGGFLVIASQLAYMVAGDGHTAGRAFETLRFNDKHPNTDPVTGEPLGPLPFVDVSLGFAGGTQGVPLPTLDLPRVFVLTGGATCSASESIINALRGVDVEVIQVGNATCGKPYGFYPTDNCGTTYFSIQFQAVNEKGFGDYADGFSPAPGPAIPGAQTPGCVVADDFAHPLGDTAEARLAAALHYRQTGSCPAAAATVGPRQTKPAAGGMPGPDAIVPKSPWLENRSLERWPQ